MRYHYTKFIIIVVVLDLIAMGSLTISYSSSKDMFGITVIFVLFFIPIVLYIGFFIFNYFFKKDKKVARPHFKHIEIDKLLVIDEIQFVARFFGEGAVTTYITNRDLDPNFRLKAFLIISEIVSPTTVEFLKLGLSDTSDEIRLLSFSLINNLEKKINNEIFELKRMLQERDSESVRLKLAKLHWELIYLHLVDDTLKNIIIEEIGSYLDGIDTKDAKLLLLKIAILKRDFTQVEEILNQLDEDAETVPYLLELAFYQRDFERLQALMRQYPEIRFIEKFYSIYRLWHDC
ncbi:MAG: hypothetical protein DSY46_04730 [Hydrogenimonas sp.]|nr:MAG: hypothetical protein DSY46_04730 [Hydrogenimonas sp.]